MKASLRTLTRDLENAPDYASWREAALQYDQASGMEEWKQRQTTDLYDHHLLRSRLNKLQELRKRHDDVELLYTLNEGIHGNLGGMGKPVLYQQAKFGTKKLIVEYIDEVVASLLHIRASRSPQISLAAKIDFFRRASHCFGRSALMLSGGANLGMFHLGVVKALFEQQLLPTVVSGSSAGSVVAAVLATHNDEQLKELLSQESLRFESMRFLGWKGLLKGDPLMDADHLEQALSEVVPDMTFDEAFKVSRRAVNISISPARLNHESRMLNAITSPNVFIRKGVMASCAVPGLFPPVTLMAKNFDGEPKPYNPSRQWVDGSLTNDLPRKRLSRIYGVNHYIASQVNPHVVPFVSEKGMQSSIVSALTDISAKTTKSLIGNLLSHGRERLRSPVVGFWLTQAHAMFAQDYSADIIVYPSYLKMAPWKLFSNPSEEEIAQWIRDGERATWPRIEMIRNTTKISRTLDSILADLEMKELDLLQ